MPRDQRRGTEAEGAGAAGEGAPDLALPEGWEIADYAGQGGQALYAVYANGRRMASGMPTPQSAARWARLLAASRA